MNDKQCYNFPNIFNMLQVDTRIFRHTEPQLGMFNNYPKFFLTGSPRTILLFMTVIEISEVRT